MPNTDSLVRGTTILLSPNFARVVLRTFLPHPAGRLALIAERVRALSDREVARELTAIRAHFSERHEEFESALIAHYAAAQALAALDPGPSPARELLTGAYFTSEYAFESAALFNPSIVLHPDQSGLAAGSVRFIMSLRATGEGHISSLTFRTGTIDAACRVGIDPLPPHAAVAFPRPEAAYDKATFGRKLAELGCDNDFSRRVLALLPDSFDLARLQSTLTAFERGGRTENDEATEKKILWLAYSNYSVSTSGHHPLSYWVVFPASPTERNGIEDARFVRFVDDDGAVCYYATYTAYDGAVTLPQLIETDFRNFKMITLNGPAVRNKGMALFPRRLGGRYAMLSRQDNDSLYLMYSDNLHFWYETRLVAGPAFDWEFTQIGNNGSPVETEAGWLVLTHGVGPLRQYSIGAMLLDRDDPSRVIGRLARPLIVPAGEFRDGYVPNVVYSCGSLVHGDKLVVPYALADLRTTVAIIDLPGLLRRLKTGGEG